VLRSSVFSTARPRIPAYLKNPEARRKLGKGESSPPAEVLASTAAWSIRSPACSPRVGLRRGLADATTTAGRC